MTNVKKKLVELPIEVAEAFQDIVGTPVRNDYIIALRNSGWTLTSISNACGITRERARQIVELPVSGEDISKLPLPEPPRHPVKVKRVYVEPSAETLSRLLELQPKAKLVRSNVQTYRKEAEEYTKLLNYAHTVEGVPIYRLALRIGVTSSALQFRLARYGYKKPKNGKSKVYNPIRQDHRVIL
jgi:hypothetical protein